MLKTKENLLAIANAEVGYLEKETNKSLDSKTANAGDENYTKYARDLAKAGYYQASKQGLAWCDMFVDWCFYKLCQGNKKAAEDMICQTGVYGAGCGYSANYYKAQKRFYKTPEVGDQIFFWNATRTKVAHTGLVYAVDNTYVYTIEGNTSSSSGVVANGGGVFKKKYKLNYLRIYGYGRPKYENTPIQKETFNMTIKVLRQGDKGSEVKAMQLLLVGYGYKMKNGKKTYTADGSFGPATANALTAYKIAKGLGSTAVCDEKTWKELLGQD